MLSLTMNPRAVTDADFPSTGSIADQWTFLLNYALLAPSEYNTQPWMFRVQGASVEIFADYSRSLPLIDPENRELLMSCGAACFNLRLAARHFGLLSRTEHLLLQEQSELLARLRFWKKRPATPEEDRLFASIARRQSNRSVYEKRGIPEEVLSRLKKMAEQENAWLKIIQDAATRKILSDLIIAGDRRQWADQRFRQELAQWVHPRMSGNLDGLPGYAHAKGSGLHDLTSPFVVRTFDLWREEAARDQRLVAGAPALAVLGSSDDRPRDWFTAGMAMQRVLLEANASDLQTSFVNQPIEVPSLRTWLRQALGQKEFPQLIMRIGYGNPTPLTPRRSVQDVLLDAVP